MTTHDEYAHRILTEIEAGKADSQRVLARNIGIALGLTNLLIRKLVHQGWVKVIQARPNRVRYLVTPAGIAQKTRMTRAYLGGSIRFYAETRDRIRERFHDLSAAWPVEGPPPPDGAEKRVVFLGGGEVAEIGYVCLHGTDLRLTAVIDDEVDRFFDVPTFRLADLDAETAGGHPYGVVIVMSFTGLDKIRRRLERRRVPKSRVCWI